MKFPSKFNRYSDSSLKYLVKVIKKLQQEDLTIRQFRADKEMSKIPIDEFINILDVLYALNKIEILKGGILHYVSQD